MIKLKGTIKGTEGDNIVKEEEHPCWELLVHKNYGSVDVPVKEYKKAPRKWMLQC